MWFAMFCGHVARRQDEEARLDAARTSARATRFRRLSVASGVTGLPVEGRRKPGRKASERRPKGLRHMAHEAYMKIRGPLGPM